MTLGARYLGEGRTRFRVWAPKSKEVHVHILDPDDRVVPLQAEDRGYHQALVDGAAPGCRYVYRLDDGEERPDPASRSQPDGVHAASQVVDFEFPWKHEFGGRDLKESVLYEIHVGTFTAEGTFDAVIPHLDGLVDLGVTTVELMPIAQFPGGRNWGYDGVYPFAVQSTYGGPSGLKRLVDACHGRGLALVLDVVYNHLGPEGNYLDRFGHYLSRLYRTPWGQALNFDGPHADEVRRFFLESALYLLDECRVDGLRLDAIHAIVDQSARPFLEELGRAVRRLARRTGRRIPLIAECNRNDPRTALPTSRNGLGLDAVWNDDFHHAMQALLTGERAGHLTDFREGIHGVAAAFRNGFVFTGQYSRCRARSHGRPARSLKPEQFVVFAQNHDQVGNRRAGDRPSTRVTPEKQRLAAALLLLSPFTPMLFMGEEYGETAPFPYFVSHADPDLVEAVRRGRLAEFETSGSEPPPDPQSEETFRSAVLDRRLAEGEPNASLRALHRELLRTRRTFKSISAWRRRMEIRVVERDSMLTVTRRHEADETFTAFHFGEHPGRSGVTLPPGRWRGVVDSSHAARTGDTSSYPQPGAELTGRIEAAVSPFGFALFARLP